MTDSNLNNSCQTDQIKIVLLETSHPGNIGATARAMKTMGLSRLVLVNPIHFPDPRATAMASRADDLLQQATVVNELSEAVADCALVIGTSSDPREIQMPGLTPRQAAPMLCQAAHAAPVAVVFGPERSGLTSDQLLHCNYHLQIPSDTAYNSLNLAQAVQIICYELHMFLQAAPSFAIAEKDRAATFAEVNYFFQHLEKTLLSIGFLNPSYPKKIMPRLKRLFNRAKLEHMELQLLRGILTKMEESVDG